METSTNHLSPVPVGTPSWAKMIVSLYVVRETEKAYCVALQIHDQRTAWIPKSADHNAANAGGKGAFGHLEFRLPLWAYERLREQLT